MQNPTTRVQNPPSRPRPRVPAVEIGERAHDDAHLLLWQLRGSSRLVIDGEPFSLCVDQAIWVPAGTRHAFTQEHDSVLLPIFLDDAHTATTLSEPRVVDVADGLSLLLLAQLQTQYTIIQPDADIERQILALLEETALSPSELPMPTSEAARAVAETLRFNPGDGRSVPELAASVHTAERTLQRAFLAETGMTLRQWRLRNRMAAAATLLSSAARLSAVAHRVGYTDDSAFRRAFRTHFGMAPREYATGNLVNTEAARVDDPHPDTRKAPADRNLPGLALSQHSVRLLGRYLNSRTEAERLRDLCERAASERVDRTPMSNQPARTSFSKLKPAQYEEILRRYQAGERPVDIARDFGVTEWTIQNVRKRAGAPTRPKGLSEQALARAAELYAEGVSFRKIALAVGRDARTVTAELRARGIAS